MAQESRVKKSLLNARVNLIFYFLTLALSFFSRKIFLDCLGADFVGLTGTLQNLLGFLNLAELGISTAIGYVLYKPLFDHDEAKINEIISVFGYLYRWIGRIILGAGCILACFLPLIFPDTQFELGIIFFAYFAFLTSSLIGYFANYKQTLLGADQKNYVVTAYFQTATIVKTLIQMASAYYTGSYYLWVVIELAFGIIYSFILNWKINQVYPWLKSEVKQGKLLFKKYPEVMKYTKQLFLHKIGGFVQFQMSPILIYSFVSLQLVAYYGNYSIIIEKISVLFNNVFGSISAGVGNLIAEGNKTKIMSLYWELISHRFIFAGLLVFLLYKLVQPFITFWLGTEYLLDNTVLLLLLINLFITLTRLSETFLYGFGLFSDTLSPFFETIIYLIVSILGGFYIGLSGIVLAGIVSQFIIGWIWKPYFLYRSGFKHSFYDYLKNILTHILLICIALYSSNYISESIIPSNYPVNLINMIKQGFISILIYSIIACSLFLLFTRGSKRTLQRLFIKYDNK
ncbi:lipopolysaccharide biosynthesis protein [Bacteroides ndongoniae]|uniref:lipopolysaccharide biosynthesis protein n=1 Tax=Bacteroides ndongoniae TaxID=1903262 RepID=UPI0008DA67D3|nr:sugar transporter [Bacteroides ndongoniae]